MSLGRLVVAAMRVEGRSKSEVARSYGISWRWVHELVKRFDAEGEAGLEPRSRRPHRCPLRTSPEIEDEIVLLRKQLEDQGLDAGAHTIAFHLTTRLHARSRDVPSVSTIWRILVRRGFVTPQPQKRPKSSFIRFVADQPNERWQADITHWKLDDEREVEILNIIDDHSRLLVASRVARVYTSADVVATFHEAAQRHGLPSSVLTDNGAVFTANYRNGRCAMESELLALGIRYCHSRPYHPQTCGKVERFHQTEKKWLDKQPAVKTIGELQSQLDGFTDLYNTLRPHRALKRSTPMQAYLARPKAAPTLAPVFTGHHRVRRDKVDKTGNITIRHKSRLHHVGIGRAHKGIRVIVLIADLDVRVITEEGELLRAFTLDPTRDYQPQSLG